MFTWLDGGGGIFFSILTSFIICIYFKKSLSTEMAPLDPPSTATIKELGTLNLEEKTLGGGSMAAFRHRKCCPYDF